VSYESVNIYVKDATPTGGVLPGVVVKVYSRDGKFRYGENVTDVDGLAAFLLPAPEAYQVRLYKFDTAFSNPIYIDVLEAPVENGFELYGDPFHHPQATDPRLCLASGFFRTASGSVAKNVDIHFIAKFDPLLLEGAALLTERVTVRSDAEGYAQVSLVRCGQYDILLEGMENIYRTISVPEEPWVNLPDLLFPRVQVADFNPAVEGGSISIDSGDELVYDVRVGTTDRRWLPDMTSDVLWSVGDPTIATLELTPTDITIKGLTPGTTQLLAVRKDTSVVSIPNTAIVGVPVTIVVS